MKSTINDLDKDAGTSQKDLLVARTKEGCQEICTGMLQMPTE